MAGWSIGRHWVQVDVRAPFLTIFVDEEKMLDNTIPTHLLGEYPLKIGKREVVLKRVRNLDVARSEIWIDGVKVPPSEDPIPRRKPPKDGICEAHPGGKAVYREPGAMPEAKLACGVCRAALCNRCVSVDAVRCKACFDKATAAMMQAERDLRIKGPLLGVALGVLVFIFGLAFEIPRMAGIGLAAIVLVGIRVGAGYWKEKQEAKNRPSP
ncbi:hypothetical protein [Polyangium sp. 6x1]|uniref:hypothetical protein n=1 Tax=Polyangium sp. 6x1 TaxID=3042689 RepID=UPI0024827C52|nr:hypothetical protein [Polyangium sp. 6x1]MDI1443162.1 hypothetical protein [Polyangium sp. 6x1]